MFKKWLKQFVIIFICAFIVLSPVLNVYASNYETTGTEDEGDETNANYYIIEGKDVNKLFDFGISDVDNILAWTLDFKTFTVIKSYTKDDKLVYKAYFNTPNLQSLVKNKVISSINDGYTDDTYNINDTEWIVKVGKNAKTENVITKYGFNVPNYTYMGEYPKATMSVAGVIPTTWYGTGWRAVKSVFGASFIQAPDSDNYNTITYMNHTYTDKSEFIVQFFQKYYLPYFDRKITKTTTANGETSFDGPDDLISMTVTEEDYNKALSYNKANEDQYILINEKVDTYNNYKDTDFETFIANHPTICGVETIAYLSSSIDYRIAMSEYGNKHKAFMYMIAKSYCDGGIYADVSTNCGLSSATSSMPTDELQLTNLITAVNQNFYLENNLNANLEYTVIENDKSFDVVETLRLVDALAGEHADSIVSIDNGTETSTLEEWNSFMSTMSVRKYEFKRSDFISSDEQIIWDTYTENQLTINKYETFIGLLEAGDGEDASEILYRQCMIKNQGKDTECYSKKYGDKTSLSIANVYAYSGLYKISQDYPVTQTELSEADVHKILTLLQNYCGPYYSEVLGNMMKLMCNTAASDSNLEPFTTIAQDDKRVMPYDTDTLTSADKENYACTDPRVEMYKDHVIGSVVSKLTVNYGLGIYIKPQKIIVDFCGRITELSIFMQQLINFDVLDGYGLSPANMWTNVYISLILSVLALFFIVKTIFMVIKNGTGSLPKILSGFFVLFIELALFTSIAAAPEKTWTVIKNIDSKIINLGEMASSYSNPDLVYLFGDSADMEVTYYIPYLDIWSKFNTGYGIMDNEQLMNKETDTAELVDIKNSYIGSNEVNHYSVLLMDSFSYYGKSSSAQTSVMEDGIVYNGNVINSNAYRVVDHFMAPRVKIKVIDDTHIDLKISENENYNGEWQSGLTDLIAKMMTCLLMCLLSIIKCMTFIWQWFMLYIFIFRVILGKGAEKKTWPQLLTETFAPSLCMIFIGLYSGIVMNMGMNSSGVICICLNLFLFWLTFMAIRWWKGLNRGLLFPGTLEWMYILTNFSAHSRNRAADTLQLQSKQNSVDAGVDFTDDEISNLNSRTERLFNQDGQFKSEFDVKTKHRKVYEDWYTFANNEKKRGKQLTDIERRAMLQMESDDRFHKYTENVQSGRRFKNNNKLNKKLSTDKGNKKIKEAPISETKTTTTKPD